MIATNIGPDVERVDVGSVLRLAQQHAKWGIFVMTQFRTEIPRWAFSENAATTLENNYPEMGCQICISTQFERRHCRIVGHTSSQTQDDTAPNGLDAL